MRVMILGARGMLGTALLPHLLNCGLDVMGDIVSSAREKKPDLTNYQELARLLDLVEPAVVINLVALTNVDECDKSPKYAYLVNAHVVKNLVRWIKERGNRCHIVQISTDHVYDGPGPHAEDNVTPSNYYALTKLAGEFFASTIPSTILRTNFFGPSLRSDRCSLSDWLIKSLVRRNPITVFDDVYFSPLSMSRLLNLIELVVNQPHQGIFNLGSRSGMSKADFAYALADAIDLPTQSMKRGVSTQFPHKVYRPKDMRMDSSKFEIVFGVKLPNLLEEIQSMKVAYAYKAR